MTSIVKVFTRNFTPLDEFNAIDIGERNWILNGVGSAQFAVPLNDPKATKANIHIGNMVWVESDLGISPWVGRIDEINWASKDTITFSCNGREALMRGIPILPNVVRTTADIGYYVDFYSGGNGGFVPLVGISSGNIYSERIDPKAYSASMSITDFLDGFVSTIAGIMNAEWYVEHDTGKLNFQKQVGSDKTNDVLLEQTDFVGTPSLRVNSNPLIWSCLSVGGQHINGWTTHVKIEDAQIRSFVGGDSRGRVLSFPDVTDEGEGGFLETRGKEEIEKSLRDTFSLDISINNERNFLNRFFLGDTIGVNLYSLGWMQTTNWRVWGISIAREGETNEVRLILKPSNPRDLLGFF